MVISDVAPIWSNLGYLGQSATVPHHATGAFKNSYCPADAFEEECQNPDNPYGEELEMFGLGHNRDYGTMGQGVMFPEIHRANVAINPLSGLGQNRVPDTAEFSDLGQARVPDMQELRGLGQGVMFPEIKRANVAINPLSGLGRLGQTRISDDTELVGLSGSPMPSVPQMYGIGAAAVLFLGGHFGLKGEIGQVLKQLGIVVGGVTLASYIGQVGG